MERFMATNEETAERLYFEVFNHAMYKNIVLLATSSLDYSKDNDVVHIVLTDNNMDPDENQPIGLTARSERVEGGVNVTVRLYNFNSIDVFVVRHYFVPVIPGFEWVHAAVVNLRGFANGTFR